MSEPIIPPDGEQDISPAELQDLVLLERTGSVPEAGFLVSLLEDEGIPAVIHGESLSGLTAGEWSRPEVRVPRVLLDEAKAIILKGRDAARTRGIEDAFTEEKIEEEVADHRPDPEMVEMQLINHDPPAVRDEKLAAKVAKWTVEGINPVRVAQYLAVAGLSLDEAAILVKTVRTERKDLMEEALNGRVLLGLGLAAIGVCLSVFALGYGVALIVAGLAIALQAYTSPA
jgi:hypothetical protein